MNLDRKQPLLIPDFVNNGTVQILAGFEDYNHRLMNLPEIWKKTRGKGVRIAILDTGVARHRDLEHVETTFSTMSDYKQDRNGHGTFVAGQLFGDGDVVKGIAQESRPIIGAIMDSSGCGSTSSIINGINMAVDHGADVISMSLGISGKHRIKPLEDACDKAYKAGVTLVAASGNEGRSLCQPAVYDSVISVGAVDQNKRKAAFSNRGYGLDFVAGGVNIWSTWLGDGYRLSSGTSMACPAIAGLAGLIIAKHSAAGVNLSPAEVKEHIRRMAYDLGDSGYDSFYGYGIPIFGHNSDIVKPENQEFKEPGFWGRVFRWLRGY
jgi:subtilisin family serine protease